MSVPRSRAARVAPAALVSGALLSVSALSYVVTVLAARVLTPASYGELAALLGVLLVGIVPATGLQTATALRLGGRPPARAAHEVPRLHATALATALAAGLTGLVVLAPVVALLRLPDATAAAWMVAVLVPHTLAGAYDGVLQGTGRHGRLAAVVVAFGSLKTLGALAGLLLGRTPSAALAGMAAGCAAGAAVSWLCAGRPGVSRGLREPARAAVRAAGALLGLVLLVNLDVLLARHHLPADLAGEYAVGAVFAKVAYWLPQGVGVVVLPRLADAAARRRELPRALAVVGGSGALLTVATAALGPAALPLVGGDAYGSALGGWAWVFTACGALFALAQLLLYSGIAAADRVAAAAVWVAVALECVGVEALAATGRLSVLSAVGTAAGAGLLLVSVGLLRMRAAAPDPEADAAVAATAVSGGPVAVPAPPAPRPR
ncbi:hypothetical protein [Geodermatophilus amargosae]|uniref:hypothetical protein n=1 Tax=Geodermatophilus amargosae TaxID=1296565 RepID=UPI0034DF4E21